MKPKGSQQKKAKSLTPAKPREATPKRKSGRPSKLTPETQEKICLALRGGNFRSTAAQWAGVSYRVFLEWMKVGSERPKSRHGAFRAAVIEAEKAAEIHAVGLIVKAAAKDPKHAEWWLSHRHSERWADKARMQMRAELTGKNQAPLFPPAADELDLSRLTDEELTQLEAIHEAAAARKAASDPGAPTPR